MVIRLWNRVPDGRIKAIAPGSLPAGDGPVVDVKARNSQEAKAIYRVSQRVAPPVPDETVADGDRLSICLERAEIEEARSRVEVIRA